MIIGVKTNRKWLLDIAGVPVIGGFFLFIICFVPPVIATFLIQFLFPTISGDPYFGYILAGLLPLWNLFLYVFDIRLRLFFMPVWLFVAIVALIKFIIWIFNL